MKTIVHWKEVEVKLDEWEWYLWDTHFDWHFTLWGFEYFPETYKKENELSGDEYRKWGTVRFFRNHEPVYEVFCRTPEHAVFVVAEYLTKLKDFNFDYLKEWHKLYWRDTPATVWYIMSDQWAFIVKADPGYTFPESVLAKEDWQKMDDNTEVKIDIFDQYIWWFRD